jgi:hypothetical protein
MSQNHFFSDEMKLPSVRERKLLGRAELAAVARHKWRTSPPRDLMDFKPFLLALKILRSQGRISKETHEGLFLTAIMYPMQGNTSKFAIARKWTKDKTIPKSFVRMMYTDSRSTRRQPFAVVPLQLGDVKDLECQVCSDEYNASCTFENSRDPVRLPACCSSEIHTFHRDCITKWLESVVKRICPCCRIAVTLVA